jgi:nucleotide-binding universal stress UspA family protein
MPGTLVVGYDGSDGARAALDEAVKLAKLMGARVHLAFAFQSPLWGGELRDLDEAVEERAHTVLEHGQHQAAASGLEVTTQFAKIEPAEGIVAIADEVDADYVVVGSYGERPLKSAIVGSTPTRLLHLCERPLLVIHQKA